MNRIYPYPKMSPESALGKAFAEQGGVKNTPRQNGKRSGDHIRRVIYIPHFVDSSTKERLITALSGVTQRIAASDV
jgi:hypothetical protein